MSDPEIKFPNPFRMNGRLYWRRSELESYKRTIIRQAIAYRTGMVWAKDKIGMGYYVRNQHEHLLVCKRGDMPHPPESARRSPLVEAPRLGHSAKPPIFYDLIDAMYPDVRKIELFNREGLNRPGWEVWGNQATPHETACFEGHQRPLDTPLDTLGGGR